jgi:hypothetical protein
MPMNRHVYLDLASRGVRMPIGADLVLHEEPDPEAARRDGTALGRVIERAARRWNTPLAMPLMDLRLEKFDLLALASIPEHEAEAYQFSAPLDEHTMAALCDLSASSFCAGSVARNQAIAHIALIPGLLAVGMVIGPFSLATRLVRDPISAVALAGMGTDEQQSPEIQLMLQSLRAAEAAVLRSIRAQVEHGARAMVVCEPAACTAFFSPRQLKAGSNSFERFVMGPNLRIRAALQQSGCDLIFHDCGELIDSMVADFARRLHPVILSLGSSRKLWNDARLVPTDVVLYGNLPSKSFYSDAAMPVETVVSLARELIANMQACGHPHIVGSECDVLFVPEAQHAIHAKVHAIMSCTAQPGTASVHASTEAVHT